MFESFGAWLLPLFAAALHPFLGRFIQSATRGGVGLSVIVGGSNILTLLIFAIYLRPSPVTHLSGLDWLAVANGVLFFFGQWFSIRSVKVGDIAVHSSALGGKILVVAVLASIVGLESSYPYLFLAAMMACVAVFLTAGGSLAGWKEHRKTVGLTLLACVFFGVNDFLTGWQARELGSARWLTLMMGTSALMSVGLLASRWSQIKGLRLTQKPVQWIFAAGVTLGVQALLVNIAFSHFQQPTLSNVAYSTRGVMAVIFLWFLGERKRDSDVAKPLAGAVLMVFALYLALQH